MANSRGSRATPRETISGAGAVKVKASGSGAAAVVEKAKRVVKQSADTALVRVIGFRGAQLVTAFCDSNGRVSVDRVAERFGMSKSQLAETIGLKRETVYRAARLEAPKTQARATEMLEIIGRVGDDQQVLGRRKAGNGLVSGRADCRLRRPHGRGIGEGGQGRCGAGFP